MAKCKECDYPFATLGKCTNCGSDNPTGPSLIGGLMVIIVVVLIYIAGGSDGVTTNESRGNNKETLLDTSQFQPSVQLISNEPAADIYADTLPPVTEPSETAIISTIEDVKVPEANSIQNEEIVDALTTSIDTLPLQKYNR